MITRQMGIRKNHGKRPVRQNFAEEETPWEWKQLVPTSYHMSSTKFQHPPEVSRFGLPLPSGQRVNLYVTMENHNVVWENSLFQSPCSIAILIYFDITRGPSQRVLPPCFLTGRQVGPLSRGQNLLVLRRQFRQTNGADLTLLGGGRCIHPANFTWNFRCKWRFFRWKNP